jgi:hypothetical protein
MLADPIEKAAGIVVKPNQMVLPNHLWLGVEEVPASSPAGRT